MAFRKIKLFYYNNKYKIWTFIGIVALVIIIINILNNLEGRRIAGQIENANESSNQYVNNIEQIYNPTKSLVDNQEIDETSKDNVTKSITNFLDYCINGDSQKAYELLSPECKEVYYPTYEVFYNNYFMNLFSENKTYTYQLWANTGEYVFIVKIMDNAIDTGKISDEIAQDYITVVRENNKYLININSYINRENIDREYKINDNISITIKYLDQYMDNSICTYQVKNRSDKNIRLNAESDAMYLLDQDNVRHKSYTNEIEETNLLINANTVKTVQIPYNNAYISDRKITKFVFENVILDYDAYLNLENKEEYNFVKVEI